MKGDKKVIEVEVTQEDIDRGSRASARHCPIALACARHFGVEQTAVSGGKVVVWKNQEFTTYYMRREDHMWYTLFDANRQVSPTRIVLSSGS